MNSFHIHGHLILVQKNKTRKKKKNSLCCGCLDGNLPLITGSILSFIITYDPNSTYLINLG